ncbi:hypothetical protein PENSPDRAFT_111489 [Peniophora sp. CONT]|nr:hypothetical protein PENSPDRAFT_111489 [Peniophora sp. CONT]
MFTIVLSSAVHVRTSSFGSCLRPLGTYGDPSLLLPEHDNTNLYMFYSRPQHEVLLPIRAMLSPRHCGTFQPSAASPSWVKLYLSSPSAPKPVYLLLLVVLWAKPRSPSQSALALPRLRRHGIRAPSASSHVLTSSALALSLPHRPPVGIVPYLTTMSNVDTAIYLRRQSLASTKILIVDTTALPPDQAI